MIFNKTLSNVPAPPDPFVDIAAWAVVAIFAAVILVVLIRIVALFVRDSKREDIFIQSNMLHHHDDE